MNKKITIKDIAREAHVSVATVSYVLNNRTEERISDETRKKVMQIANFYAYAPNKSAIALASNKSHNIVLYLPTDSSILKRSEQLLLINSLTKYFKGKNYSLLIQINESIERLDNVDAIICCDISTPLFHAIGDNNFVPLLAIDCLINDEVFYQITPDFGMIKQQADNYFKHSPYSLVCLNPCNTELKTAMRLIFPNIYFITDLTDLNHITEKNLLVIEKTLHQALPAKLHNIFYYPLHSSKTWDTLYECMNNAIDRVSYHKHFFKL